MTKHFYCLAFFIIFTICSFSQKNSEPTEADQSLAKSLKDIYPDEDLVIEESEDVITFKFNKNKAKVTVNVESTETMINIDARSNTRKLYFYDGQSTIDDFQVWKNNVLVKGSMTSNFSYINFDIKDKAYTSDDLFHNDVRVKYTDLNFPLLGYKCKTQVSKTYHDIKYFTQLYFTGDYPTIKKVIKIEVPNWLELELKEINFEGYSIKKDIITNTEAESKTYVFTLKDIPAAYKENKSPGPTYIYPHILILAKSFSFNEKKENIFNTTQDLYNWYKSLVNSLENDNTSIKDKVKSLTEQAKNDEEKIKNIYYWVQDNIRYIAFEDGIAGFKPDEAANVFNKKYGDCKGMANLTKQMLIEAGFDARLAWIGTKRIAYNYSTPNLSVDNHMICSIIKDGKTMFLDATEKFNAYGEYADRIQGKQVLIENGDEYILETVPEITSDFNKETLNYTLALNNEILEGKASINFKGESRAALLYLFDRLRNDKKQAFLESYLNNSDSNIKVSNIETSDLSNRESSLNINYDISIKNAVSSFDNTLYIDINFDKEFDNFLLDERKTDYVFNFKRFLETSTILKIPSGYTITKIPESISISSDNYDMNVNFTKSNNIITYTKSFKLKNAKIETSDFEEWNQFISKLKNIYREQIVITQ